MPAVILHVRVAEVVSIIITIIIIIILLILILIINIIMPIINDVKHHWREPAREHVITISEALSSCLVVLYNHFNSR